MDGFAQEPLLRSGSPTTAKVEQQYEQGGGAAEDGKNGTVRGAIFNLSNTIIGSGVLAMPFACKQCGVVLFLMLVSGTCTAAHFALMTLMGATEKVAANLKADEQMAPPCRKSQHSGGGAGTEHTLGNGAAASSDDGDEGEEGGVTYPFLGRVLLGRQGELLASWSVTLQQIGACIAYVVIIADFISPVLTYAGAGFFGRRAPLQVMVVVVIVFPLCLLRRMDSLRYTSLASLCFIFAFCVAVWGTSAFGIAHPHSSAIEGDDDVVAPSHHTVEDRGGSMHITPSSGIGFLKALPILSFAFLCHQNAFPIYNELRGASLAKMRVISRTSMTVCAFTYMTTGVLGYHLFLEETEADLLKNYKVQATSISTLMDVVRCGFGISFVLSYPVIIFEARANIDLLLFGSVPYDFWRFFKLNVALVGVTTLVGILAPTIDVVLGLVGSTCSPTMMFVLPALFGLKADDRPWTVPDKRPALVLLIFGCALIPVCSTVWALCDVANMSFCPK